MIRRWVHFSRKAWPRLLLLLEGRLGVLIGWILKYSAHLNFPRNEIGNRNDKKRDAATRSSCSKKFLSSKRKTFLSRGTIQCASKGAHDRCLGRSRGHPVRAETQGTHNDQRCNRRNL